MYSNKNRLLATIRLILKAGAATNNSRDSALHIVADKTKDIEAYSLINIFLVNIAASLAQLNRFLHTPLSFKCYILSFY